MNKYYYDFITNKLKKDIQIELHMLNESHSVLLDSEIESYFQGNTIEFNEVSHSSDTHQVRNRDAYQLKENRCKALVWNEGYGGQCSRSSKEECNGFVKHILQRVEKSGG